MVSGVKLNYKAFRAQVIVRLEFLRTYNIGIEDVNNLPTNLDVNLLYWHLLTWL